MEGFVGSLKKLPKHPFVFLNAILKELAHCHDRFVLAEKSHRETLNGRTGLACMILLAG